MPLPAPPGPREDQVQCLGRGRGRAGGGGGGRPGGVAAAWGAWLPPAFFFSALPLPPSADANFWSGEWESPGRGVLWDKKGGEAAAWRLAVGRGGEGSLLMTH